MLSTVWPPSHNSTSILETKCFCKTSFQVGVDLKNVKNMHEMKERQIYRTPAKMQLMSSSLLAFFHLMLCFYTLHIHLYLNEV